MKSTMAQIEFLVDCGAADVKHSGRTLLDHLEGTARLLREWGQPEHVIAAGLFHSIYGTNTFKKQLVSPADRDLVVEVIGPKAERLAFAFGHINRPKSLFHRTSAESIGLLIDNTDYRDLQEIEAANLLEQGSTSRWLGELMTTHISEAAKAAITRHIKYEEVRREIS